MSDTATLLRRAGLSYLERLDQGTISDDQWERVTVSDGNLSVQPSEEAQRAVLWQHLFAQLFITGAPGLSLQAADDLLFFIRKVSCGAGDAGLFVRRKVKLAMPSDCTPDGREFPSIDWPATVLLNLALQTPFYLTVSSCRTAELHHVLDYGQHHPSVTQVSQHVFASPTRVDVNLDSSRTGHSEPEVTYPNLCFAVDNFDCAFGSMVLQNHDDCYAVCLWAVPPLSPQPAACAQQPEICAGQLVACAGQLADCPRQEDLQQQSADECVQHQQDTLPDGVADGNHGVLGCGGIAHSACEVTGPQEQQQSPTKPTPPVQYATDGRMDQHAEAERPRSASSATELVPTAVCAGGAGEGAGGERHPLADPLPVDAANIAVAARGTAVQRVDQEIAARQGAPGTAQGGAREGAVAPSQPVPAVLLFAGYVPFDKLQSVVDTSDTGCRGLLQAWWAPLQSARCKLLASAAGVHPLRLWTKSTDSQHRVRMKGPGGLGHADVAVTVGNMHPADSNASAVHGDEDHSPGATMLQLGHGLFTSAAKLAGAAAKAAKGMAATGSGGAPRAEPPQPRPVRCALMTLTLPVNVIAKKLLQENNGKDDNATGKSYLTAVARCRNTGLCSTFMVQQCWQAQLQCDSNLQHRT